MSIYAEVNRRFHELYCGDDDRNEFIEILEKMPPEDQGLWRMEAEFEFSYRRSRRQARLCRGCRARHHGALRRRGGGALGKGGVAPFFSPAPLSCGGAGKKSLTCRASLV